jgi:hypothetical protein
MIAMLALLTAFAACHGRIQPSPTSRRPRPRTEGYSLRAGFATAAARAGRSEAAIMCHGRWKSVQIARRYIRQGAR